MNTRLVAVAAAAFLGLSLTGYAVIITRGQPSLAGDDVGAIRRKALAMFPIGTNINDVARGLIGVGFRCYFRPHLVENITATTLDCSSNDGNLSLGSRNVVEVVARNGNLTDIAVADSLDFQRATAAHPDPARGSSAESIRITPKVKTNFDAFDKLVEQVMWQRFDGPHAPETSEIATAEH